MSALTGRDLKDVLAEFAKSGLVGVGMVFNEQIWLSPQNPSPIRDFCVETNRLLRKACLSFYDRAEGLAEPIIQTCPLGFQVGVIPISFLCDGHATVFIHLGCKQDQKMRNAASPTIATLPRKNKKRIKNLHAAIPSWKPAKEGEFSSFAPQILKALRRKVDEKTETALETVLSESEDFVASFSHEALSPIQQVRSTLERAAIHVKDSDLEAYRLIDSALTGLDRVRVSLEGMRLLFRPDTTLLPNRFSDVNASEILHHWVDIYSGQFEAKNIQVVFDPPPGPWRIWAVKEYFEVLARNLVSNAIKYSFDAAKYDKPGKVIFRFLQQYSQLCVTNYGVLITEDDITGGHLFTPGGRGLKSHDRGRTGKGVGLYLVKKIADLHEATVTVQSEIQNPGGFQEFAKTDFTLTFKGRPLSPATPRTRG